MQKKILTFLQGQLASAVFFIILGFCLAFFPYVTIDLICKVVFGLLLIVTGLYNILLYVSEKVETTILNMFAGVIVLVLGLFLFSNPQIVVLLMPQLLAALVLIDSIWLLRCAFRFRKKANSYWHIFMVAGAVCVILGIIIAWNPFAKFIQTVVFSGVVCFLNGLADVVFYFLMNREPKKAGQGAEKEADFDIPSQRTDLSTETGDASEKKRFFHKQIAKRGEPTREKKETAQDDEKLEEWKD